MADITQIKVGSTTYDLKDNNAVHLSDDTVELTCNHSTTSASYRLLMTAESGTGTGNATTLNSIISSKMYANPSTGKITAQSFHAASDLRLKENIKDFIPKNSILDLPIVEFDFKDSGSHQIGCIAQDLQKLFPELVESNEEGYLSIAENKLVYLCLLEIKKLKAELEVLKANKE